MATSTKNKRKKSRRRFIKIALAGVLGIVLYKTINYFNALFKLRGQPKNKVFAANLWILQDFDQPSNRYQNFLDYGVNPFKMFVESILIHDQIVIPTQDFMVLQLLRSQFSEKGLFELLESDCVRFCRFNGMFGYQGGKGLCAYQIIDEKGDSSKSMPFCAPVDQAVEWAISSNTKSPKNNRLLELVINQTDEITAESIDKKIRNETYEDILKSEYLRSIFSFRNQHLNKLYGVSNNQIRCLRRHYSGNWTGDEVDIVLMLAQTNLELYLSTTSGCIDISTASPIGHLIKAKAQRSFSDKDVYQNFAILNEIASVPDIGDGILQNIVSVEDLIKLRESINGRQFRIWFHNNCRKDTLKTAKEYTSLLKEIPAISSLPVRILRFIATSSLSSQLLSLVGGVTDSFFIESLLRGYSPKYFIEDVSQLIDKQGN